MRLGQKSKVPRRSNGRFYAKAQNVRPTITKQFLDEFEKVDVLSMPTVPRKANAYKDPIDYKDAIDQTLFGGERGSDIELIIANTAPYNYTGFPLAANRTTCRFRCSSSPHIFERTC